MSRRLAKVDRDRRAFLRGALLTTAGREAHRKAAAPLGPAPPWLTEPMAEAACQRCPGPCAEACKPDLIRFHPPEHDMAELPYLSFNQGGCNFCGACAAACPWEPRTTSPPPLGVALIDTARCLSHNGVVCFTCLTACAFQAISRQPGGEIHLDAAACTGCGSCLNVCPSQAVGYRSRSPDGLKSAAATAG